MSDIQNLLDSVPTESSGRGRGRSMRPFNQVVSDRMQGVRQDWAKIPEEVREAIVENLSEESNPTWRKTDEDNNLIGGYQAILYGSDAIDYEGVFNEHAGGYDHSKSAYRRVVRVDQDGNTVERVDATDVAPPKEDREVNATEWCRQSEEFDVQEHDAPFVALMRDDYGIEI